jgi:hypothetical protein
MQKIKRWRHECDDGYLLILLFMFEMLGDGVAVKKEVKWFVVLLYGIKSSISWID